MTSNENNNNRQWTNFDQYGPGELPKLQVYKY